MLILPTTKTEMKVLALDGKGPGRAVIAKLVQLCPHEHFQSQSRMSPSEPGSFHRGGVCGPFPQEPGLLGEGSKKLGVHTLPRFPLECQAVPTDPTGAAPENPIPGDILALEANQPHRGAAPAIPGWAPNARPSGHHPPVVSPSLYWSLDFLH